MYLAGLVKTACTVAKRMRSVCIILLILGIFVAFSDSRPTFDVEQGLLPDDLKLLGNWACGCSGVCKSSPLMRGATGYGANIGKAISDCQAQLEMTCINEGGLKTYVRDTCIET